jgi:hypothetical protein
VILYLLSQTGTPMRMQINSCSTPYSQCQCQLHQCAHTLTHYQDHPSCNPVALLTSFFAIFKAPLHRSVKAVRERARECIRIRRTTELGLLLQGPCLLVQMQCGGDLLGFAKLVEISTSCCIYMYIFNVRSYGFFGFGFGLGNDGLLGC